MYRAARGLADAGRNDSITSYEHRFLELRQALPARGVVGYTSGTRPEAFTTGDFKRFVLTEYALAPLLVLHDTAPELVVGNFADSAMTPPPGFRAVRDFGHGVWLLRKTAR
ncbi:MAG: hypothetical protein ACJ8DC_05070 [Gemmatimonadales bacterium]